MNKYQALINQLEKNLLELETQQARNKELANHYGAQSIKDSEYNRKDFHKFRQDAYKGAFYALHGAIKNMKTLLDSVKEENNNEK